MSASKHLFRCWVLLVVVALAPVGAQAAQPIFQNTPPGEVVALAAAADNTVEGPAFTAGEYRAAFFGGMSLMALFEVGGLMLRLLRSARASGSLEIGG